MGDRRSGLLPFAYLIGIVASYVVFLGTIERHLTDQGLPLAVFGLPRPTLGVRAAVELGLLVVAQSCLLYGLTRQSQVRRPQVFAAAIAVAIVAMLAFSLRAPFIGSDAYYYGFYGRAPSLAAAYHPVVTPHEDPGYGALDRIVAVPVVPSVYGPLWQIADRAVVGAAPRLASAFIGLRVVNSIAFALFVVGVAFNRFPIATTAAVVCNPALYYEYLASAHNDIFALAALVWIRPLLGWRFNGAALVLGGLIGATKISVMLVAFAAFSQAKDLRMRLLLVAGALVIAAGLSIGLGGTAYFHSIEMVAASTQRRDGSAAISTLRILLSFSTAALALAATAIALLRKRIFPWAAYTFVGASSAIQGWYLPWGIGYALTSDRLVRGFAVALPLLTFDVDTQLHDAVQFPNTIVALVAIIGAVVIGTFSRPACRVEDVS